MLLFLHDVQFECYLQYVKITLGKIKNQIFENILENMHDGVMSIDFEGHITTFNSAAEKIIGIEKDNIVNRSFAEVFLVDKENDDFNQTM